MNQLKVINWMKMRKGMGAVDVKGEGGEEEEKQKEGGKGER